MTKQGPTKTKSSAAYEKASDAFEAHVARCTRCIEDRSCVTVGKLVDRMAKASGDHSLVGIEIVGDEL